MGDQISTHGIRLEFGRHKGKLLTRVPVSYLRWMINANTQQAGVAREEFPTLASIMRRHKRRK